MNIIVDIMADDFYAAVLVILTTALMAVSIKDITNTSWFRNLADRLF